MLNPQVNNESPRPTSPVPGYGFDGLIASDFDDGSTEAAISLLLELARAQEFSTPQPQEARTLQRSYEIGPPLEKLPPSPWRSLGGYFDYCYWADRERFMELDRAIAAAQHSQLAEIETDPEIF